MFVDEFNLSITKALRDQLSAKLEELEPVELSDWNLGKVERHAGVYQLFLDSRLVYVGKASTAEGSSGEGLRGRLGQHRRKIGGRFERSVGPGVRFLPRMSFVCLYVPVDLDAVAPEKMMIAQLQASSARPVWNGNGFGSNDPGKHRDGTLTPEIHFDWKYPVDLNIEVEIRPKLGKRGTPVKWTFNAFLGQLADKLPFTFRWDRRSVDGGRNFQGVLLGPTTKSAREWLAFTVHHLPPRWELCVLPGRVIAYPAAVMADSASISESWRTTRSGAVEQITNRDPLPDPDGVIPDDENSGDT